MKQYLFTYLFLLFFSSLIAQSSVFVMVDVSGSTTKYSVIREEAEKITRDLIKGEYLTSNYRPEWKWLSTSEEVKDILDGNKKTLINPQQDGYLMIMPFGIKDRYNNYKVKKISNLNEIDDFFDRNYPEKFGDPFTYNEIARAMAAALAKGSQINVKDYFLIEISDQLTDTDSKPPQYTEFERRIMSEYGTGNVTDRKIGTLYYESSDVEYQIVVKKVNITNLNIQQAVPNSNNVDQKSLTLNRPTSNSTKSKPQKQNAGMTVVSWGCLGCDSITNFSIRITNLDNKKTRFSKTTNNFSETFKIDEPGVYQVTLNAPEVGTKNGYFEIEGESSSGGGGFLVILLLLALGFAAYTYFKRQSSNDSGDDKRDYYDNNKPTNTPPPFNSGSGGLDTF